MRDVPTVEQVAEVIAKSRYEAWDEHGHAGSVSWEEFQLMNPAVARHIYLADGRRDAEALMPLLRGERA